MEFPRQEYWSGLPFPSPGHLPNPGIKPGSPTLQADSLPCEPPGKPETSSVQALAPFSETPPSRMPSSSPWAPGHPSTWVLTPTGPCSACLSRECQPHALRPELPTRDLSSRTPSSWAPTSCHRLPPLALPQLMALGLTCSGRERGRVGLCDFIMDVSTERNILSPRHRWPGEL